MSHDKSLSFQDFLDETEPQRAQEETERLWANLQALQAAQQQEQRERDARKARTETLVSALSRISSHAVCILNEQQIPRDGSLRYSIVKITDRFSLKKIRRLSYWQIGQDQDADTAVLCNDGSFGVIVAQQRNRRPVLGQLNDRGAWLIGPHFYDAQCQVLRLLLLSDRFTTLATMVVGNSTKTAGFDDQFIRDVCGRDYTLLRYKFRPIRPDQ